MVHAVRCKHLHVHTDTHARMPTHAHARMDAKHALHMPQHMPRCTARRVWDVAQGRARRAPLTGHRHWVRCVALSVDAATCVSGSDDRTLM